MLLAFCGGDVWPENSSCQVGGAACYGAAEMRLSYDHCFSWLQEEEDEEEDEDEDEGKFMIGGK